MFIELKTFNKSTCKSCKSAPSSVVCRLTVIWVCSSALELFVAQNQSLDYLRGTLGFSYMCREMQTLGVAPDFAINTFQVQVQPFGVNGTQFAAGRCQQKGKCIHLTPFRKTILWFFSRFSVSQLRNASWMKTTC